MVYTDKVGESCQGHKIKISRVFKKCNMAMHLGRWIAETLMIGGKKTCFSVINRHHSYNPQNI